MTRPAARRAAVLLPSVVLVTLLVPLVGIAAAAEPTCPVDGESGSLDYRVFVWGEPQDTMAGNVEPGDRVVVEVTVPEGCPTDDAPELTLATYTASEPTFPSDQDLVTSQTALLKSGRHELVAMAPESCFQVDLVWGSPLPTVSENQRYGDRLIDAANGGSEPCGEPSAPLDPCPAGDAQTADLVEALDPVYSSGDRSGDSLGDVVVPGEPVTVDFTVPDACAGIELTLASYTASGPTFPSDQKLDDYENRSFSGPGSMTVTVPDCYYQVDFARGEVIDDLEQDRYGPRLIDAANGGTEPCDRKPLAPPDPCPIADGTRADLVEALDPVYSSGDRTGDSLDDVVVPGKPVTVDFNVPASCAGIELTLASYTASGPTFPSDQKVHESVTETFAGPESMTVTVPGCYYQVDFARGEVIEDLEQDRYGPRLIDAANGGTEACEQSLVPGPSETTTAPPSEAPTPPSEAPTPPSEAPTPPSEEAPPTTATPVTPEGPIIVVAPAETERPVAPAAPATPAAPVDNVVPVVVPAPGETPSLGVVPDSPSIVAAPAPGATALAATGLPVPVLAALAMASLLIGTTLLSVAWRRA